MARARPDRLTPEEAAALVEEHGTQRKAAKAAGVAHRTIQRWLDPEGTRKYAREYEREYALKRRATDAEFRERRRTLNLESYHRTGWLTQRKRELVTQRSNILSQLDQLQKEKEEISDSRGP